MKQRAGSALEVLNEAIELVRSEPLRHSLRAAAPALLLTWLMLFTYYLEQVEGVLSLRPACALGLALGWCARAALLSRYAGHCVQRELGLVRPGQSSLDTRLRAALLFGAELWLWLWLLVAGVRVDPWLCLLVLPLFTLRGALAPSWLAAVDAAQAGTQRSASWYALKAARGQRLRGIALECLLLLSALGLFLNLGALIVAAISLSQDLLGLRLAFVRAFISPRNQFALLALGGLTLSAFEPLRAAVSAVLYADQRRAHEAMEVRALVEAALGRPLSGALLVLLCVVLGTAPVAARAQTDDWQHSPLPFGFEEECDTACRDARARDDKVLVQLVSILDAGEFREFSSSPWALGELERPSFGRWLSGTEEGREPSHELSQVKPVPLPLGLLLGGLSLLVLLLGAIGLWHTRGPRALRPSAAAASPTSRTLAAPSGNTPDGTARGQLRQLYLATLQSLAQRGLLTLSSASTNGDYLRMLSGRGPRAELARLTQLFEHSQYGRAQPSEHALGEARALAATLQGVEPA